MFCEDMYQTWEILIRTCNGKTDGLVCSARDVDSINCSHPFQTLEPVQRSRHIDFDSI